MKRKGSLKRALGFGLILFLVFFFTGVSFGPSQAEAAPFAYIPNYTNGTVSVVDAATNTVVKTIGGFAGPLGVAVSPDGSRAYITEYVSSNGKVKVIDTSSNTVIAAIPVGSGTYLYSVAVSPDGSRVYVGGNLNSGSSGSVTVIDAGTNTVSATIDGIGCPSHLTVSLDGSKVYVANPWCYGGIKVIDTSTYSVSSINVGHVVFGMAMSPDGLNLYAGGWRSHSVSVVDTASNAVTATINVGSDFHSMAVSPDGTKIYVPRINFTDVAVIDTSTNSWSTIPLGVGFPTGVSITPDGSRVYVIHADATGSISVIDTFSQTKIASVSMGSYSNAKGNFFALGGAFAGLISRWEGDSVSGATAIDLAGENDGTLMNGAATLACENGSAFSLDGVDDYIYTGKSVLNTTGPFSVSAWVNTNATEGKHQVIVSEIGSDNQAGQYMFLINPNGTLRFSRRGGGVVVDEATTLDLVPVGVFTHVAAVYGGASNSDLKIYVNGVLADVSPTPHNYGSASPAHTAIGAGEVPNRVWYRFGGLIDDIRLYNRDLSGSEVQALFGAGGPGECQAPQDPDLVTWWQGEGDATDSAGSHDGALVNGATFAPGISGQAFSLDGVNDYVEFPSSADWNFDDFTVEAWFKGTPPSSPYSTIVGRVSGTGSGSRDIDWVVTIRGEGVASPGTIMAQTGVNGLNDNAGIVGATNIGDDQWHHIVYVKDGDEFKVFVDGRLDGSTTKPLTVRTSAFPVRIGWGYHYPPPNYTQGLVDEVKIYSRALSPEEILASCEATNPGACTGPVSRWDGDNVSGATATDLADGNDGALMNGAATLACENGSAFSFDGVDDYIHVPDSANLYLPGGFALSGWFKFNSLDLGQFIIAKLHYNEHFLTQWEWAFFVVPGGQLRAELYDSSKTLSSQTYHDISRQTDAGAVSAGQFYHLAVIWDGSASPDGIDIYVNGVPVDTTSRIRGAFEGIDDGHETVTIGASLMTWAARGLNNDPYGPFHGTANDIQIFDRPLSASEVQAFFDAGGPGECGAQNQSPVAQCQSVEVVASASDCTASASVDDGSHDPDEDPITLVQDPQSPYGLGATPVTLTVTDDPGESDSCTETVTVVDKTDPTITPPANVAANTDAGICTAARSVLAEATGTDNCSVVSVTNDVSTPFSPGTTTVNFTATDTAGNTAETSATVTVTDNENPVVTAPAPVTANADTSCQASVPLSASAGDNCSVSVADDAPASYGLGNTTVTFTATDGAGAQATDSTVVTVVDTTPPTISVPADLTLNADLSTCTADTNLVATGGDNCSVTVSGNGTATYPLGVTTVNFTATDGAGLSASGSTVVTVEDTTAPAVTAALVPVKKLKKKEGTYRVEFGASDVCFGTLTTTAAINGVPVENGMLVKLKIKKKFKVKYKKEKKHRGKKEKPRLEIRGPSFELVVTSTDGAGNTGTAVAEPEFKAKKEKKEKKHEAKKHGDDDKKGKKGKS